MERFFISLPIRVVFPMILFIAFIIVSLFEGYVEKEAAFRKIEHEYKSNICSLTGEFQELSEYFINKGSINLIERKIANLSANQFMNAIFLIDPEGKIIISAQKKFKNDNYLIAFKEIAGKYFSKLSKTINKLRENPKMICEVSEDKNKIISIAPILFPSKDKRLRPSNVGFLFIMYDLEGIKEKHKKDIIYILISELGIMLILLGTIYLFFSKLIAERIEKLLNTVREISKGNLDVKVELKGNDEFSVIAGVIDDLIRKLKKFIKYDYLTGIYNRFAIENNIKEILRNSEKNNRNILIFMDIDNFKEVNDTFGHNFGDILLRIFAKRLKNIVKCGIVGRLGGDEFLIFIQDTGELDVKKTVETWMKELSSPYKLKDNVIEISVTAGISIHKGKNCDFYRMLKESDIALYYGKKKGKSVFIIFDDNIRLQEEKRIRLSNLLRHALEKNEFYLEYQPIFDLKTEKIVSVEALLRWKSSDIEYIPPSDFIPILEETGLIKEVGKWILEEACKQIATWHKKGVTDISVSVNIDIQQILEENFVDTVSQIVSTTCPDPKLLKLEITESEAMKFPESVIQTLRKLNDLGIEISIDDFGTGYSSLSYLKMMPVTYIKIDRSFIKDLPKDKDDRILTKAIIELSKNFGYKTVAEGVETKDQLIFLKEINCNMVQGFYFCKPLPPEEIEEILQDDHNYFRHKWRL
ncbi:EAL domain-containing protein [Persephonella sp.]